MPIHTEVFWRRSSETIYRRFLMPVKPPANALVQMLVDIDHRNREALIVLDECGIVGVARYGSAGSGASYGVWYLDWPCEQQHPALP